MINNETLSKISNLKMDGFCLALKEQLQNKEYDKLGFMERIGMLVDREVSLRESTKLQKAIIQAKFRQSATIEDIDFSIKRNLNRKVILDLANCTYIKKGHNILITGPTGVGKSYLSCALGNKACINDYKTRYYRTTQFFMDLKAARHDEKFGRLQKQLSKIDVLILDDFGLQKLDSQSRLDFLDILDDRVYSKSTIIVTQLPIDKWHELIGDSTIADAILDRFIHNAYQIEMKGDSMRKLKNSLQ